MSFNYFQSEKLFSFHLIKGKDGKITYNFGEKFFPQFDNRSSIINPPLDLMVGVEEYLQKSYSPISLCHWDLIVNIHKKIGMSLQQITNRADVVCYRGFLEELIITSLGERSEHKFISFMYDGIIFIERLKNSTSPISSKDIEKAYMKRRLNKFCTIPYNKKNPDTYSPVNFEEGYYVTKCGTFQVGEYAIKVTFTGDFDAIDPNNKCIGNNFMKIKVCPGHIFHLLNGVALYKTWAQSYISGNRVIGAGIRRKTLVKEVKYVHLPELETKIPISKSKIINFVGKCLMRIVSTCKKNPEKYVIIPEDKISLRIVGEDFMKGMNFSRPTKEFLSVFPETKED